MNIENPMVLNNWHDKLTEPETQKISLEMK